MSTNESKNQTKAPAKISTQDLMVLKNETVDGVMARVKDFQKNGELDLPPQYSAANALKSAWLILQGTSDKNGNPVLVVCSKPSIANALLDMVVQGLNPAKKQCYFIPYGKSLTLMRSYFGAVAVTLRLNKDIADIYAEVVYEGDSLEYRIDRGKRVIETHKQSLGNIDDSKIIAAYAVALGKDGEVVRSELMTMDQIKKSWRQSKLSPINDKGEIKSDSTHGKFTAEMAKKTVTNRLAKHFINESDDSDLVIKSVRRSDDMAAEAEAEAEIEANANTLTIDITPEGQEQDGDDGLSDEEKAEILAQEAREAQEAQRLKEQESTRPGPGF
ncbi:MAG: recombinase RecT [Candidatus Omnitrophica bacterium]|nr:recombinase RecT [Candidatus Omnitrophota bacterium]